MPKKRIKPVAETKGPNYRKVKDRLPGFDEEREPARAKHIVQAFNDRGYDVDTFRDTIPANYFHTELFGPGYPPAKKIEAATAYWITGSYARAERICGVPAGTIRNWAKGTEWWPLITTEIKKDMNEEMDARLTGLMFTAMDELEDRMLEGDSVYSAKHDKLVKRPMSGRDLTHAHALLFEKRALLRGDPTAKIEKVTTDQRLNKLQQEFQKFSKAKTIKGTVVKEEDEK